MSRRKYDDDDGRIIADMSNLETRSTMNSWFGALMPEVRNQVRDGNKTRRDETISYEPSSFSNEMDKEDRRILLKEAIKMSLGVGMIYVVVFFVFILLLVLIF